MQAPVFEAPQAPVQELTVDAFDAGRRERTELGGVLIDQVDVAGAVQRLREFLVSGKSHQVVTVNLDFLSIAQRDQRFRHTLNAASLAVADGMPLVWASRWQGSPLPERVAGVELVHESCQLAVEYGRGVFLLGAAPGIAEAAGRKLQETYPSLQIAGAYSPPLRAITRSENARILRMIRESQPGFLFVALGAPRQDLWIRENLAQLDVPVSMGVGCVFDVVAGVVVRAPQWMQRTGLEWAYRLVQEPGRLWRRYLVNDSRMMLRLVFQSGLAPRTERPVAVPTA